MVASHQGGVEEDDGLRGHRSVLGAAERHHIDPSLPEQPPAGRDSGRPVPMRSKLDEMWYGADQVTSAGVQPTAATCVVRDANMGHQFAGGNSSWCPDLESRTTHRVSKPGPVHVQDQIVLPRHSADRGNFLRGVVGAGFGAVCDRDC